MDGRVKAINALLKKCRWQVEQAVIACGQEESEKRKIEAQMQEFEAELARIDGELSDNLGRGKTIAVDFIERLQRYRRQVDGLRLHCGERLQEQKKAVAKARSELGNLKQTERSLENKLSDMNRLLQGHREEKSQRQLDELAIYSAAARTAVADAAPDLIVGEGE